MKNTLLLLLAWAGLTTAALADDVAVLAIHFPKQKALERVVIEFYESDAPDTVANFKKLAHKGFYNGLSFHRVFPHALVQTGDPLSSSRNRTKVGTGGPGYTLSPEVHRRHTEGAVAAPRLPDKINPGRRSSGSQFYICLRPMPNLDGQYTVFGKVVSGMETLEKISTQPADSNDNPLEKVIVKSAKILPREKAGV